MTAPVQTWKAVPGYSRYECTPDGQIRNTTGLVMRARKGGDGYWRINLVRDRDGKKVTRTVHSVVLETYAGPCPRGMESRHLNDNPDDNRWPENLAWGTKPQNAADRNRNGNAPELVPLFACLNAPRCPEKVRNEGRRCAGCAQQVGVDAADMLRQGVNLSDVAGHFGYQGVDWVFGLAQRHGGYAGSKAAALRQRPPLSRRVAARLTGGFRPRQGGDAA